MEEKPTEEGALASKLLLILLDNKEKKSPLQVRCGSEIKKSRKNFLAELRALEVRGLVRFAEDAGDEPDFAKARTVRITDAGERFVLHDFKPSPYCSVSGAAFFGSIRELRRRIEELESAAPPRSPQSAPSVPVEPRPAPAAEAASTSIMEEIRNAFLERELSQRGYVPIYEIRRALPHASREAFDAALLELQKQGLLYLNKLNDPRDVPEDQIRDGIQSALRGRLFFVSRGEKPWTSPLPS